MEAAGRHQELVAQNLAHANVPGYRRQALALATFDTALDSAAVAPSDEHFRGTTPTQSYTVSEGGPVVGTGNTLDLALTGDAFFTLEGPNGPVYTRNGSFQRNARGELETPSGLPVRSSGGRITIPATAARISVAEDSTVSAERFKTSSPPTSLPRVQGRGEIWEGLMDTVRLATSVTAPQGVDAQLLATQARGRDSHAIINADNRFESLFLSMLLKEMRQDLEPETMFGEENSDVLGGLFDFDLGQHLAKSGGLGIAAMVKHQLLTQGARPT
jgi:flagellar hook-basal body protein